MNNFGKLITAMVTPFTADNAVDYAQAQKLALALLNSGSDGLVVVGTTGESPTLTKAEEQRLFTEVKEAVGDKGKVIAGTGSNNTAEAIIATRAAEQTGVDACLLVVPYYNKPSQEGLYRHFKAIAESTSLPCLLYNVPARTIISLKADTVIRLSEVKNIVGIKEASGDMDGISRIIENTPDGFIVLSGNDGDTLPMLQRGADGLISVASHLVGDQIKEMINSYLNGNREKAETINNHLLPLYDALFLQANPIPVKYALNKIGFTVGQPRLPLCEPDEKTARRIMDTVGKYKIDLPL
jgi:4-hydroxy-tetrahydrodipicolinate synthase